MDLGLKGKTALITGGTHGIGRAIAHALVAEGCRVAVCSRTLERVQRMDTELKAKGVPYLCLQADVTQPGDLDRLVDAVVRAWGKIDILVNNVGGGGRWGQENIEETDENVWVEVYEKNVLSAIRLTKKVIPLMRKSKWGRVVTITSILGREAGGRPWFCVAKTAQTSLMKSLAKKGDLTQDGITFNSVGPGAIMIPDTGWEKKLQDNPEEIQSFIKHNLPLGRFGTPEEVADVVTFICSERARLLNGASIPVDGGQGMSLL